MQLVGSKCCFCFHSIVLQSEATACARCKSVAHDCCLRDAGNLCPACHAAWMSFANEVAYSQRCPACGAVISAVPLNRCSKCGGQTAWDSHADYLATQRKINRLGARKTIGGSFALLVAGLFGALAVAVAIGHKDLATNIDQVGRDVADIAGRVSLSFVLFTVAGTSAYLGVRQLTSGLPMLRFV